MKYPIAPLFVRPWTLNGISPRLIESHYEVNYGGTVQRLNAITEQLEFLDARGCHCFQGFWVSKPLPPARFVEFLRTRTTQ